MIPSPPMRWTARLQAERTVPRDSRTTLRNGSFKVRRWPEGDRTAGAMASIAPGAASPYPTGIPHPSEPPTSSQPERWRLPWRRRQCQPSTGIVHEKGNSGPHSCPCSCACDFGDFESVVGRALFGDLSDPLSWGTKCGPVARSGVRYPPPHFF